VKKEGKDGDAGRAKAGKEEAGSRPKEGHLLSSTFFCSFLPPSIHFFAKNLPLMAPSPPFNSSGPLVQPDMALDDVSIRSFLFYSPSPLPRSLMTSAPSFSHPLPSSIDLVPRIILDFSNGSSRV